VTASRDVDAEALVRATETADAQLERDVSVIDLVLCAVSATLEEHPWRSTRRSKTKRIGSTRSTTSASQSIPKRGSWPCARDIGSKPLDEIAAERRRVTESVQSGEHLMSDLRGGTFTVTNLGVLGIDSFTPIINPPEIAILGVNRIRERPQRGDDGIEFRNRMNVDLSFDHRIVDGADAARFLATLADRPRRQSSSS